MNYCAVVVSLLLLAASACREYYSPKSAIRTFGGKEVFSDIVTAREMKDCKTFTGTTSDGRMFSFSIIGIQCWDGVGVSHASTMLTSKPFLFYGELIRGVVHGTPFVPDPYGGTQRGQDELLRMGMAKVTIKADDMMVFFEMHARFWCEGNWGSVQKRCLKKK